MECKGIRILEIFSLILISSYLTFGQGAGKEEEKLFANNRYSLIWPYYEDMLKKDSMNAELNYKMGICYLNSRSQKSKAVMYLKKAMKDTLSHSSSLATLYESLAEASFHASNFDQAIENYNKYKKALLPNKKDSIRIERANHKIELCKMAKEIKELKSIIASLAENRKVKGPTPVDQASTTFTFKIPQEARPGPTDMDFFEDMPVTFRANSISQPIPDNDTVEILKEATIATSVDGQIILLYRNDKGVCNLYATHLEGNNWTSPERLNKIINTKGWEPDEFVSADGNALYFASNRPGGYGGKDIYKSVKLPNGEWSKARNLGPQVNTPYDDEAPFIHPDGVTLFYSSKKNKKNAVYDIYTCCMSESGDWSNPKNIGYPVTRSNNNAPARQTERSFSKNDNYIATFLNQKKTPLTLIKGKILDKEGKIPGYTEITVTDNQTGEIAGIYHSDEKTGQYIFILPPGGNSTITYRANGYLFHQESINTTLEKDYYKTNKTIELSPLVPGAREMLATVSLTDDKIDPASIAELCTLFDFLQKNPTVSIELFALQNKGKATSGADRYEHTLQVARDFLADKGINKDRIEIRLYKKEKKKKKKEFQREENNEIGIKITSIKQNNL